jgi:hypothetical protein
LAFFANTGTTVTPMTRRQPATNTRFFDRRKTSPEQFSTNFHDTGISLFALPHFGHGISLLHYVENHAMQRTEPLIAGVLFLADALHPQPQ